MLEETHADMLARLKARRPGFALEQPFYTDPGYFALDLEHLWYREWLFAGHDFDVPKPGDWMTLQVGAYPIVIVRGQDGVIRALHNTCRHRGSRVCTADRGSARKLVCPYHQWSYELDGRLFKARHEGPDFPNAEYGLKEIACESVAGYVFLCLARRPPDFAPVRAQMEPYFGPHRLWEAKIAFESTIVENGNWKLVWENNRECYHCRANHPELCRTFPDSPTLTAVEAATANATMAAHAARCEAAGLPSRFWGTESGQHRVHRLPLLGDAVSYTMSGAAAVARPLSDAIAEPAIGSLLFYHFPTTWNHALGDHAVTFRLLPLNERQTQLTTKWLVHREAIEGRDYDLAELTRVWGATNDQDRRVVEENQRGILSPAYQPGPYNALHEEGVVQFVNWYAALMERRLEGPAADLSRVA